MSHTHRLSAQELADLTRLFAAPDRLEITSGDRHWRAAVLASVLCSTAMSFGALAAAPAPAPAAHPAATAPLFASVLAPQVDGKVQLPVTEAALRVVARSAGMAEIAATAVTVRPTVYPFAFRAGMDEHEIHERVVQFVFTKPIAEPEAGEGGFLGAQSYLEGDLQRSMSPEAWNYVAKGSDGGATGCVITVSDQHAGAIQGLARETGMSVTVARDFALMHESAHCAQTGEKLAAIFDIPKLGRVRSDRISGGMLGANMERLLAAGRLGEITRAGFLNDAQEQLSAERFADGFAMLALLAQGRLAGQQANGLVAWRLGDDAKHNTASFLIALRAELEREPPILEAMRSNGDCGFNATAIVAFLRPHWRAFESAELRAQQLARPLASALATPPSPRSNRTEALGADRRDGPTLGHAGT